MHFMKNYLIASLIGLSVGILLTMSFISYTKQEVKVECPQPVCPPCNPSIDFDKVKNFKGELKLNQTYTITTDSNFRELILKDIENLMKKQKLSRCK